MRIKERNAIHESARDACEQPVEVSGHFCVLDVFARNYAYDPRRGTDIICPALGYYAMVLFWIMRGLQFVQRCFGRRIGPLANWSSVPQPWGIITSVVAPGTQRGFVVVVLHPAAVLV